MILIFPLDLFAIFQARFRILKSASADKRFFQTISRSFLAKLSWWHFWYYACFALEKVRHMPMPSGVVSFLYDFCIWKAHLKIVWIFVMQKTRSASARNKWLIFTLMALERIFVIGNVFKPKWVHNSWWFPFAKISLVKPNKFCSTQRFVIDSRNLKFGAF